MNSHEPQRGDITVNGVRLSYLDWGGAGLPIVILHATGLLGRVYGPIAAALTAVGRVFTLDQRGQGDSGRSPDDDYNWQRTVDDLVEFIIAMKLEGARGVGHSAGATAIGAVAGSHPELITRAVLAEPVIFQTPESPELGWRNPFIERTLRRRRVFDSVDAMFDNFAHKPPYATWREDLLRDYCEQGTFVNADGKRELKCSPEIEARYYDTARDFPGLQTILSCEAPLLILFGQRSDSLGVVLSDHIAAQLKHGRVANVPDAGHFLPMEHPDLVARMASEFFSTP